MATQIVQLPQQPSLGGLGALGDIFNKAGDRYYEDKRADRIREQQRQDQMAYEQRQAERAIAAEGRAEDRQVLYEGRAEERQKAKELRDDEHIEAVARRARTDRVADESAQILIQQGLLDPDWFNAKNPDGTSASARLFSDASQKSQQRHIDVPMLAGWKADLANSVNPAITQADREFMLKADPRKPEDMKQAGEIHAKYMAVDNTLRAEAAENLRVSRANGATRAQALNEQMDAANQMMADADEPATEDEIMDGVRTKFGKDTYKLKGQALLDAREEAKGAVELKKYAAGQRGLAFQKIYGNTLKAINDSASSGLLGGRSPAEFAAAAAAARARGAGVTGGAEPTARDVNAPYTSANPSIVRTPAAAAAGAARRRTGPASLTGDTEDAFLSGAKNPAAAPTPTIRVDGDVPGALGGAPVRAYGGLRAVPGAIGDFVGGLARDVKDDYYMGKASPGLINPFRGGDYIWGGQRQLDEGDAARKADAALALESWNKRNLPPFTPTITVDDGPKVPDLVPTLPPDVTGRTPTITVDQETPTITVDDAPRTPEEAAARLQAGEKPPPFSGEDLPPPKTAKEAAARILAGEVPPAAARAQAARMAAQVPQIVPDDYTPQINVDEDSPVTAAPYPQSAPVLGDYSPTPTIRVDDDEISQLDARIAALPPGYERERLVKFRNALASQALPASLGG